MQGTKFTQIRVSFWDLKQPPHAYCQSAQGCSVPLLGTVVGPATGSGGVWCQVCQPQDVSSGFSLIEVVLALLIIGLLLTSLFGLQNSIFARARHQHYRVLAQLALTNLLRDEKFMAELLRQNNLERQLTDPALTIQASSRALDQGATEPLWPGVQLVKLTGSWHEPYRGTQQLSLASLRYVPVTANEKAAEKGAAGGLKQALGTAVANTNSPTGAAGQPTDSGVSGGKPAAGSTPAPALVPAGSKGGPGA